MSFNHNCDLSNDEKLAKAKSDLLDQDSLIESQSKWQQPLADMTNDIDTKNKVKIPKLKTDKADKTYYDMLSSWTSKKKNTDNKKKEKASQNTNLHKPFNFKKTLKHIEIQPAAVKSNFSNRLQKNPDNGYFGMGNTDLNDSANVDWIKHNIEHTKKMRGIFGNDANNIQQIEEISLPYKIKRDKDIFDKINKVANINTIHDNLSSHIFKPQKVPLNFLKQLKGQRFNKDNSMNSFAENEAHTDTRIHRLDNKTMAKDFTDMVKDIIDKKKKMHSEKKIMSKSQNFFDKLDTKGQMRDSSAYVDKSVPSFVLSKDDLYYLFSLKENRLIGPIRNASNVNAHHYVSSADKNKGMGNDNLVIIFAKDELGRVKKFHVDKDDLLRHQDDARQEKYNFSTYVEIATKSQSYSKVISKGKLIKTKNEALRKKTVESTLRDLTSAGIEGNTESIFNKKVPKPVLDYLKKDSSQPNLDSTNNQSKAIKFNVELDSLPKGTRTAIRLKTTRSFANLTKQSDQSNLEIYKTNKLQPYAFKINLKDKIIESEKKNKEKEFYSKMVKRNVEKLWFEMSPKPYGKNGKHQESSIQSDIRDASANEKYRINDLDKDKAMRIISDSYASRNQSPREPFKILVPESPLKGYESNSPSKSRNVVKKKIAINQVSKILEVFKNLPRGKQFVDNRNILMDVQKSLKPGDDLFAKFMENISNKDREILEKVTEEKKRVNIEDENQMYDEYLRDIPFRMDFLDKKLRNKAIFKALTTRCESQGIKKEEEKGHLKYSQTQNEALSAIRKRMAGSKQLTVDQIQKINTIEKKVVDEVTKTFDNQQNHNQAICDTPYQKNSQAILVENSH